MTRNSRIVRSKGGAAVSRLPLIGNVRIGEKRTSQKTGKEYPASLDYFKATGDYASKFDEAYPDKPSKIQIVFVSDDDWQSCYEEWDGRDKEGRRAGYGDGVTWWIWDGKDYIEHNDTAKVKKLTEDMGIKWKPVLTLHFVIPAISGVFGCWRFRTSGDKSSIVAIRSMYDEIMQQAGTVVNIPFDLIVKKVQSDKPGAASVYPVVSLVPNISSENMEVLRQFLTAGMDVKRLGMLTEEKLAELPQAGDGDKLTAKEQREYDQWKEGSEKEQVERRPCHICGELRPVTDLTKHANYYACTDKDCLAQLQGTLFDVKPEGKAPHDDQ